MAVSTLQIQIQALVDGLEDLSALVQGMQDVDTEAAALGTSGQEASDGLSAFGDAAAEVQSTLNELRDAVGGAAEHMGDLVQGASESGEALAMIGKESVESVTGLQDFSEAAAQSGDAAQSVAENAPPAAEAVHALGEEHALAIPKVGGLGDVISLLIPGFGELKTAVEAAAAAIAAVLGLDQLKQFADAAAGVEKLSVALDVVGANAGKTSEQTQAVVDAFKAVGISTAVAFDAAVKLTRSQVDLTKTYSDGSTAAQKFAQAIADASASGKSLDQTATLYANSVSRGTELMLRQLGIQNNQTQALQTFASLIDKPVASLTAMEKSQAILNDLIDQGAKNQGAAAEAANTVALKQQLAAQASKDASEAIGALLLPAYKAILDTEIQISNATTNAFSSIAGGAASATLFGDAMEKAGQALANVWKSVVDFIAGITPGLLDIGTEIVNLVGFVLKLASGFGDTASAATLVRIALESVAVLIAGFVDGLTVIKGTIQAAFGGWVLILGVVEEALGSLISKVFPQYGAAMEAQGAKVVAFGQKFVDMGVLSVQSVGSVNGAVNSLGKTIEDTATKGTAALTEQQQVFNNYKAQLIDIDQRLKEGAISQDAAAAAVDKVKAAYTESTGAIKLTAVQVAALNDVANELAVTLQTKTAEALKVLKVDPQTILTGIDAPVRQAIAALQELADGAIQSSAVINAAFGAAGGTAKTVNDLIALFKAGKVAIADAFSKDNITLADQLDDGIKVLSKDAIQLFTKDLNTAKTEQDFQNLKNDVANAFNAGLISATQLYNEMVLITQKQTDFSGQVLAAANAQIKASNDQLKAYQDQLAVQKDQNQEYTDTLALQNAEASGDENAVQLAEAKLQVDQATTVQAQAQLAQAQAQAAFDAANAAAQAAAAAAKLDATNTQLKADADAATLKAAFAKQDLADATSTTNADTADVDALKSQLEQLTQIIALRKQATQAADATASADAQGTAAADAQSTALSASVTEATNAANGISKVVESLGVSGNQAIQELTAQGLSMGTALNYAQEYLANVNGEIRNIGRSYYGLASTPGNVGMWYAQINAANQALQAYVQELAEAKQQAADLTSNFNAIANNAEAAAEAIIDGDGAMKSMSTGASAVVDAMQQALNTARQLAQSATSAAQSFLGDAESVHSQLLRQQGELVAADQADYQQKLLSLAISERLLEIQIEAAIITAKAAGDNKDAEALQSYLTQVKQGYTQQLADLATLEAAQEAADQKQEQALQQQNQQIQNNTNTALSGIQQTSAAESAATSGGQPNLLAPNTPVSAGASAGYSAPGASGLAASIGSAVASAITKSPTGAGSASGNVTNNFTLDASNLLSESNIRRTVVPILDKIYKRSA